MSKYVVTGGAGFIGSAIVRGLLRGGARQVVVLDNFLTGHEENLDEVRSAIDLQRTDIRSYEEIVPILSGADVVFHEAAIPSVPRSIDDPVPSHEINIDGTFNVLRAAASGGVRRVVYAASSSAYGDTEVLPKVETMTPRPKSPYALQKLVGEYYAQVFASTFGIETVSLRYLTSSARARIPPVSILVCCRCSSKPWWSGAPRPYSETASNPATLPTSTMWWISI